MTFLECRHSLVLCPGTRRPRRRSCVWRWNTAVCGPERESRGTRPARYERPASPRAARVHEAFASPSRRRAGTHTHTHTAARPHAGTFSKGVARLPSGQLRREAPVGKAWRRVAIVGSPRRTSRRGGRSNREVADLGEAQFLEPDRRGTRGAAKAKSTQDGLTVSGHQGPDSNDLALRVAMRQWACRARSRVRRLGLSRLHPIAFAVLSAGCRDTAREEAEIARSARGVTAGAPENRSQVPGRFIANRRTGFKCHPTWPACHVASIQEPVSNALSRGRRAGRECVGQYGVGGQAE